MAAKRIASTRKRRISARMARQRNENRWRENGEAFSISKMKIMAKAKWRK